MGGIGLPFFSAVADAELKASKEMTRAQVAEILNQNVPQKTPSFATVHAKAVQARNATKHRRRKEQELSLMSLKEASTLDNRLFELLSAKGASSWLTAFR